MPERSQPSQTERHLCGAEQALFRVQCQLDHGHDCPHRHEDAGGTTTWEPRYVAELRRERDEVIRYLDRYGRHERKCTIHYAEDHGCSCGWGGIESALQAGSVGDGARARRDDDSGAHVAALRDQEWPSP